MSTLPCPCGRPARPRSHQAAYAGRLGALVAVLHRRGALRKPLPVANCLDEWVRWAA